MSKANISAAINQPASLAIACASAAFSASVPNDCIAGSCVNPSRKR